MRDFELFFSTASHYSYQLQRCNASIITDSFFSLGKSEKYLNLVLQKSKQRWCFSAHAKIGNTVVLFVQKERDEVLPLCNTGGCHT